MLKTELKKEQILEAARDLFSQAGYSKTTMHEIADTLGMAKSALYYYYTNKEQLFMDAFYGQWKAAFAEFRMEANSQEDPYQAIMYYVKASLGHFRQVVTTHQISIKILVDTRAILRERFKEIQAQEIRLYHLQLSAGIRAGQFTPCDTQEIGLYISDLKDALLTKALAQALEKKQRKIDFTEIEYKITRIVSLILNGLLK
jgi:AcrR family transcriptional regulator